MSELHHKQSGQDGLLLLSEGITQELNAIRRRYTDLYEQMNAIRSWVNQQFPEFELYLEDVWNERTPGETHLEYILRSKITLNETSPIAYDAYKNHQDGKGVWHLDAYTHTIILIEDMSVLAHFLSTEHAQALS